MSLKDELNGLFNDRKMVTRAEQRAMENKVSGYHHSFFVLGGELIWVTWWIDPRVEL